MRLTVSSLKEMALGSNLSAPSSKNASYIIYPIYDNIETLAENVKYYVRHTVKRNKRV